MIGAVDIGGTKIAVGMVAESGQLLARAACPTDPEWGFDHALARISALLAATRAQAGAAMRGLGVGCTGPVYPMAGTIGKVEFLPGWEGANLVATLSDRFDVSVALENDADAAALAEAAWGAGRGTQTFIYVTVSTGIGGGIVLDGQLYRGVDGAHPELGHHVIDPAGPACYCGAHGCWESLAGGRALERWFKENAPANLAISETIAAKDICARGDAHAHAAIAREGYYLGLGLANLVTLFTPEVIALGGGLMRNRHLFWPKIQQTIRTTCGYVPYEKVRLVPAALGAETGLIGAACTWLHRFGRK
ncbi:MAG: ROK family protein [Chloroflexota bacterium]